MTLSWQDGRLSKYLDNTDDQKIDKVQFETVDTLELSVEDDADGWQDGRICQNTWITRMISEVTTFSLDTATNVLTITLEDGEWPRQ